MFFLIAAVLYQWEETPFLLAVCKGHSDVMNVLYQRGCDISAKTSVSYW